MAIAEELQVIIDAKVEAAVRDLKKLDTQVDKNEKGFKQMAAQTLKTGAAMAAAAVSIGALVRGVRNAVEAAGVQERAEQALSAALISTGREAETNQAALRTYASELQDVTLYGDEATLSAMALAQQLGDLSQDELTAVTPQIQNFAAAMGMDLNAAAQLVGKSIGSTTNALTRYGVEIDNSLRGSERADAVIAALDDKFGGFAESMANTASGALVQFNNAMGDLAEIGGQSIIEWLEPSVRGITAFAQGLASAIQEVQTYNEVVGNVDQVDQIEKINSAIETQRGVVNQLAADYERAGQQNDDINKSQAESTRIQLVAQREELEIMQAKRNELVAIERARAQEGKAIEQIEAEIAARLELVTASAKEKDAIVQRHNARQEESADVITAYENERMALARLSEDQQMNVEAQREIDEYWFTTNQAKAEAAQARAQLEMQLNQQVVGMAIGAYSAWARTERQRAIAAKASGIFQATVNTAEAVTKALTLGPIAGPPLAAIIGALGAAQVAGIAASPMPKFERGGSFVTNGPGVFMAGDGRSPRERVTVEPLSGPYARGGGSVVVNLNSQVVGGRDEVAEWVAEGIRRGRERGRIEAIA